MVSRVLILLYALVSYALFTISFLYALGFVGNYVVSKSIDKPIDVGTSSTVSEAIAVNLLLMSLFAIQHMMEQVPRSNDGRPMPCPGLPACSTYVLLSSRSCSCCSGSGVDPDTDLAGERRCGLMLTSVHWLSAG